jgi:hypothetical protein
VLQRRIGHALSNEIFRQEADHPDGEQRAAGLLGNGERLGQAPRSIVVSPRPGSEPAEDAAVDGDQLPIPSRSEHAERLGGGTFRFVEPALIRPDLGDVHVGDRGPDDVSRA